jgi:ABC-type polysaccharide/polyol phosphate transport system ATPase subunit
MTDNSFVIRVENVTQRFRVIHERPDSVRELFSKFFRKKVNYHDFEAVKNASLSVQRGEVVGIIGRNGSGKSTLLKIIAGVYRPSMGRVTVTGSIAPLIELGAGMHPELTGRENILLNGLLMGFSKQEMMQREERIIEFADLGDFIQAPIRQYSSGMYMRLAFAVATEVDPDILVMDEVLAVGDIEFQAKCFNRLRRFRESGKTILIVTHSMTQIEEICSRAVYLDHGRILVDGDPAEVIEQYQRSALTGVEEPILVEAPSAHS